MTRTNPDPRDRKSNRHELGSDAESATEERSRQERDTDCPAATGGDATLELGRRDALKILGTVPLAGGTLSAIPTVAGADRTPDQTLTGNPNITGFFGAGVSAESTGDHLIVSTGAEIDEAVYVYTPDDGSWSEEQRLTASTPLSVSLAVEGERLLIAAPVSVFDEEPEDASGAYLFDQSKQPGKWDVRQKLTAPFGDANDDFGAPVAMDGNLAIVGSGLNAGVAYVFEFENFRYKAKQKLIGDDIAEKDSFPSSVAVAGSTVIVGAERHSKDADNAGAVYTFEQGSDGFWQQTDKVTADTPAENSLFGNAVGITADEETMFVGAFFDNENGTNAGAAYVFERGGTFRAWDQERKLTADSPDGGELFGSDIDVLDDTAIIGASGDSVNGAESGAAYVFEFDGSDWQRTDRLVPETPERDVSSGNGVAIGGDSGFVGALGFNKGGQGGVGATYVYDNVRREGPRLDVSGVRPIQVVEDTVLRNPSGSDTPLFTIGDIVSGRDTSVLFDLTAENLDQIPADETIEFTVSVQFFDGSTSSTFYLTRTEVQRLADPSTEPREFFDSLSDDKLPVFGEGNAIQEIELEIDADVGAGAPDLTGASQLVDTFEPPLVSMDPLTVGFIEIGDPDSGGNYGGSNGGRIKGDYEDMVEEMREYLQSTYPTPEIDIHVVDDVLDDRQTLDTTPNFFVGGGELGDLKDAHSAVEDAFPNVDFDVTVAVVPEGYPNYHDDGWRGINYYASDAAVAVRGDLTTDFPGAGRLHQVVAQEAAHHFLGDVYRDDYAMRDGSGDIDNAHARTEPDGSNDTSDPQFLDSVGYDLTDGTYSLVGRNLESFMSYNFDDYPVWADVVAYRGLIDSQFDKPLDDPEEGPTVLGMGQLDSDDTATFTGIHTREDSPKSSVPGGAVTVTVRDAVGGTLDERTYPDHVEVQRMTEDIERSHETIENLFTFKVPFPEEAAAVEVEHNGTVSRLNPVERSLREAIRRLPDEAFKRSPDGRRAAFEDKLDSIDEQMRKQKYRPALRKMKKDIRDKVRKWLRDDYETGPLQPTKEELLATVEDVIARLERLFRISR